MTHALRDALVSLPDGAAHVPDELLKRDLPVIAATLRYVRPPSCLVLA